MVIPSVEVEAGVPSEVGPAERDGSSTAGSRGDLGGVGAGEVPGETDAAAEAGAAAGTDSGQSTASSGPSSWG